jgi:hypothetical protein
MREPVGTLKDDSSSKTLRSPGYNYYFDKNTGFFVRSGYTLADDPAYAPAPEILDIEVTTICGGPNGKPCPECYKANSRSGRNMSLRTFKDILDRFPANLTQLAFGADATSSSNPDLLAMATYARAEGVIPNITVADVTDRVARSLAEVMGAVAVSRYGDKDLCYDSVARLVEHGLDQVNIHLCLHEGSVDAALETLEDMKNDPRLAGMKALVFLSLKKKGRGVSMNRASDEEFLRILRKAKDLECGFGFDSCSANRFLAAAPEVWSEAEVSRMETMVEPCESGCFSSYINVDAEFYPCSFMEGSGDWETGIPVLEYDNFLDVWNHERTLEFRRKLLDNGRGCPVFQI